MPKPAKKKGKQGRVVTFRLKGDTNWRESDPTQVIVQARSYPVVVVFGPSSGGYMEYCPVDMIEVPDGNSMEHEDVCKLIKARFPKMSATATADGVQHRRNAAGYDAHAYQIHQCLEISDIKPVKGFTKRQEAVLSKAVSSFVFLSGRILTRSAVVKELRKLSKNPLNQVMVSYARSFLKSNPTGKRFIAVRPGQYAVLTTRRVLKIDETLLKR